jgi:glycosyltransferase involved in cell wall biosynthesis
MTTIVMSNIKSLTNEFPEIDFRLIPKNRAGIAGIADMIKTAWCARSADYFHFDCPGREGVLYALFLNILLAKRVKFVLSDVNLNIPKSLCQHLRARLKGRLLQRVDVFLLLQQDFSGYQRYFAIDPLKVRSLPFKVNSIGLIKTLDTSDQGFIFAGGSTLRDWRTFAEALAGLDMPVRIGLRDDSLEATTFEEAPTIDGVAFSKNVMAIRHTAAPIEWLRWVAGAKFVCLPIMKDSLNPSGISTYLSCMALGKCVIISDGPAVRGFLEDDRAVIVPPGDPAALRAAIDRVAGDTKWRDYIAARGRDWALSLGGEETYYRNLVKLMGAA